MEPAPIEYLVESSRGPSKKSAYVTRYRSTNIEQAKLLYNGINVGNGYKKRLVKIDIVHRTMIVLDRQFS